MKEEEGENFLDGVKKSMRRTDGRTADYEGK